MDLILIYYDYPYNTHVSDIQSSSMALDVTKEFLSPDITVCNIIPLKSQLASNIAINNYRQRFASYKSAGSIPEDYEEILNSALGLLQYIGVDAATELSHERDTFIQVAA